MSHTPERKEKDCLNCGTLVQGKYCHKCGQANVVPKESFWAMLTHFVYDITHFDGKFFETVRILLQKPGFLSQEYVKGKRASYLNPIRMYVFTSAFFFLVFFSINKTDTYIRAINNQPYTQAARDSVLQKIDEGDYRGTDSALLQRMRLLIADTSKPLFDTDLMPLQTDFAITAMNGRSYRTLDEYDSVQNSLAKNDRDGWLSGLWNKRVIQINQKYRNDPTMSWRKVIDVLLHQLPYLLFLSLPFFALLLKWLYYRRKDLYFADHGIFTIHHYIVSFILFLLIFLWSKLQDWTNWWLWDLLNIVSFFALPVYLYKAMRRFYGQGRGKTILKFVLLNLAALLVITLLFTVFTIFSVMNL